MPEIRVEEGSKGELLVSFYFKGCRFDPLAFAAIRRWVKQVSPLVVHGEMNFRFEGCTLNDNKKGDSRDG